MRWRGIDNSMKNRTLSGKEKRVIRPCVRKRQTERPAAQKQHKFIPQTFREFYEDVRADTDAQTSINDISSGSGKPSCKPY